MRGPVIAVSSTSGPLSGPLPDKTAITAENEAEVAESRAILAAHRDEVLTTDVLDIGRHELGTIPLHALKWATGTRLISSTACW